MRPRPYSTFAEALDQLGWTVPEAARRLHATQDRIWHYRAGRCRIPQRIINLIRDAYHELGDDYARRLPAGLGRGNMQAIRAWRHRRAKALNAATVTIRD